MFSLGQWRKGELNGCQTKETPAGEPRPRSRHSEQQPAPRAAAVLQQTQLAQGEGCRSCVCNSPTLQGPLLQPVKFKRGLLFCRGRRARALGVRICVPCCAGELSCCLNSSADGEGPSARRLMRRAWPSRKIFYLFSPARKWDLSWLAPLNATLGYKIGKVELRQ